MKSNKKAGPKKILKVLSDDVRFDIVLLLATGKKCVCEIYESLELKQSIVSHHLGVLRENDLITNDKDGKWVYYSLNRKCIEELQKTLTKIISTKERSPKC